MDLLQWELCNCYQINQFLMPEIQFCLDFIYNHQKIERMFGKKSTQMTLKSFPMEKIAYFTILISFILQKSDFTQFNDYQLYVCLSLKILTVLLKFIFQGAKPLDFLFILAILAEMTDVLVLEATVLIALTFAMTYFCFYEISIIHKGEYSVGYKHRLIQGQEIGVFYPTQQSGQLANWIQNELALRHCYDLTFINPLKPRWIPWVLFKLFTSYMNKVKMPAVNDASIFVEGAMGLVIFSHGLSSTMNAHSSYCSWLASQGYIVVSIQHNNDLVRFSFDEHLFNRPELLSSMLYLLRNSELKIRAQQMENMYLSALRGDLLSSLFPESRIAIKSIQLVGHSFGGATCLETMMNLQKKRIPTEKIHSILCIDPWVFPLSKQTLQEKINKPMKFINSQSFIDRLPKQFRMRENLTSLKMVNGDNLQIQVLMGSDHIFSGDVLFVCGNGVKVISKVQNFQKTQLFFEIFQKATLQLFENDEESKQKKNTLCEDLLRQQWRFVNPQI